MHFELRRCYRSVCLAALAQALLIFNLACSPAAAHKQPIKVVNVLAMGAKGDGKTDDLAAINKALKAAGSTGRIYFPGKHTYACSGSINLGGSQLAYGDGPTSIIALLSNASPKAIFNLSASGSMLKLLLQGNSTGISGVAVQNTKGPYAIEQVTMQGQFSSAINLVNANRGTISGNTLANAWDGQGESDIWIEGCNGLVISNNVFSATCDYGILTFNFKNSLFSSNIKIIGNHFTAGFAQAAIMLTGVSSSQISSNIFNFTGYYWAVSVLIQSYYNSTGNTAPGFGPVSGLLISSNQMINSGATNSGAIIIQSGFTAGKPAAAQNIEITSNTITQVPVTLFTGFVSSMTSGIFTMGDPGSIKNLTVSQNTITGSAYAGIWLDLTDGATITKNTISNTEGLGVYVAPNNSGTITVSSNTFKNCGTAPPSNLAKTSSKAVIDAEVGSAGSSITKFICSQNTYDSVPNFLQYFIYCGISKLKATVSGNLTNTLLSTYIAP